MSPLNAIEIGDGPRLAVICHGILGAGTNWRSFARKLAAQTPEWRYLLVDLRNHGRSQGQPGPHSVTACAQDVADTAGSAPVEAIIGHSFGGKVALAFARDHHSYLEHCWVLDSPPGPLTQGIQDSEVAAVMQALRAVPQPLKNRRQLVELLSGLGFSTTLSQWMTTNLRSTTVGLVWRFNLDGAQEMLRDYFAQDFWPLLRNAPDGTDIHIVQADQAERWTPGDVQQLADLPSSAAVTHHLLANSGHWVHVDNPAGLMALLVPSLNS